MAVYNDYPEWSEIEVKYDDTSTYQLGLLDFPGNHKIFPVDGQHRVEGIKAALKENAELGSQTIAAIFIGHKNDEAGKQKTRRLFSTLNRYAKPVSLDDIIALDEDDIVAITTRYLLEEYDLFSGKRIVIAKQKGIPPNNKEALTSIITLYQANVEIFKAYYTNRHKKKLTKSTLTEYLKFRPSKADIDAFQAYNLSFWNAFKTELGFIADFLTQTSEPVKNYRNQLTGGNLIFRPIGFLPLVKAVLLINERKKTSFTAILKKFNLLSFELNKRPWLYVLWNPIEKKMLTNPDALTQLLLVYLYDPKVLNTVETKKLKEGYAAKISYPNEDLTNVLKGIRLANI